MGGALNRPEPTDALGALVAEYAQARLSRRDFVQRAAALGVSVPAAASLLAAVAPLPSAAQEEPQSGGRFTGLRPRLHQDGPGRRAAGPIPATTRSTSTR